jgi:hypothetical protein
VVETAKFKKGETTMKLLLIALMLLSSVSAMCFPALDNVESMESPIDYCYGLDERLCYKSGCDWDYRENVCVEFANYEEMPNFSESAESNVCFGLDPKGCAELSCDWDVKNNMCIEPGFDFNL